MTACSIDDIIKVQLNKGDDHMKVKNKHLDRARQAKNDEYYTLMKDIEAEMQNHPGALKGKIVYCNCDNPQHSKFFEYFAVNFEMLELKELITTHYVQPDEIANGDRAIVSSYKGGAGAELDNILNSLTITEVEGSGSFDSAASIEQLKRADIVISNPPFSRWRDYFKLLNDHKVDYLIVGPVTNVSSVVLIPYLHAGKVRVSDSRLQEFEMPGSDKTASVGCYWYTSLPRQTPRKPLTLTAKYDPEVNKKYDDYGAVNVDKVKDIPGDYYGEMGVPITFFGKHDERQFRIIEIISPYINGKKKFQRMIIKRIQ